MQSEDRERLQGDEFDALRNTIQSSCEADNQYIDALRRGLAGIDSGDLLAAREHFAAAEASPQLDVAAKAAIATSMCCQREGMHLEARRSLERAIDYGDPYWSIVAMHHLAVLYYQADDLERALSLCRAVLLAARHPVTASAAMYMAAIAERQGDRAGAQQVLDNQRLAGGEERY